MHRLLSLVGAAVVVVGGGFAGIRVTSALGIGEVGAFGSGTMMWPTGPAVITVDATNTGDGVNATGVVRFTYPGVGITYSYTADVLCVRNAGGLIVVGSVVTQTNGPAGPGPGLVIVIQDNGAGGPDRVGVGFEPPPVTASTSDCEVSPTIFGLNALTSGDFSTVRTGVTTSTTTATTSAKPTTPVPPATSSKPVVVRPVITKALITPRPRAGKAVLVSFNVTRSDTGARLTSGKMISSPSVQGELLDHGEQFKNGVAMLWFTVPKTAKSMLLKVHLTITLGAQSATRVATFRIG